MKEFTLGFAILLSVFGAILSIGWFVTHNDEADFNDMMCAGTVFMLLSLIGLLFIGGISYILGALILGTA